MSKSSKKKGKVPKISEAEYAEYIASLKKITPPEIKNGGSRYEMKEN